MRYIAALLQINLSAILIMNAYYGYSTGMNFFSREVPTEGIFMSIIIDVFLAYFFFYLATKNLFGKPTNNNEAPDN